MAVLVRSNSEELPKAIGSKRNGEDPTHVGLPIIAFTVYLTWEVVVFTTLGAITFKHKCTPIIIQRLKEIVAASKF